MHAVIVYAKNPAVLTPLSPDTEYITPQVAGIIPVFDNG